MGSSLPGLRMRNFLFLLTFLFTLTTLTSAYWDGVNDMPPSGRSDVDSDRDGLSDAVDKDDDDDDNDGIPDEDEDDDGDGVDNDEDEDDDGDGIPDDEDESNEL